MVKKFSPERLERLKASGAVVLHSEKKPPPAVVRPEQKPPDIDTNNQISNQLLRSILSHLQNQPAPVINVASPEVVLPERKPIRVRATIIDHNSKGRIKTVEFQEIN